MKSKIFLAILYVNWAMGSGNKLPEALYEFQFTEDGENVQRVNNTFWEKQKIH